jgi:hypothetical protein
VIYSSGCCVCLLVSLRESASGVSGLNNASFIQFGIWTDLHMSFADLYFCCVQSFISLLWTQKQNETVKELCEEHFILCTPEKKSHQQCPLSVWILWNPL